MYIPGQYVLVFAVLLVTESGILFVYTLIGLIKQNPLPYLMPPPLSPYPQCQNVLSAESPSARVGVGLQPDMLGYQPQAPLNTITVTQLETVIVRDTPLPQPTTLEATTTNVMTSLVTSLVTSQVTSATTVTDATTVDHTTTTAQTSTVNVASGQSTAISTAPSSDVTSGQSTATSTTPASDTTAASQASNTAASSGQSSPLLATTMITSTTQADPQPSIRTRSGVIFLYVTEVSGKNVTMTGDSSTTVFATISAA